MEISLSTDLQNFIETKVKSGQYDTAEAVVRGALEALRDQERWTRGDLEELRELVREGVEDLNQNGGEDLDIEDIKQAGRRILREGR